MKLLVFFFFLVIQLIPQFYVDPFMFRVVHGGPHQVKWKLLLELVIISHACFLFDSLV